LANETPALNVNKRRQVTSESSEFAWSSGERASLITAWLQVRVLPGPPIFSTRWTAGRCRAPSPPTIWPTIAADNLPREDRRAAQQGGAPRPI